MRKWFDPNEIELVGMRLEQILILLLITIDHMVKQSRNIIIEESWD